MFSLPQGMPACIERSSAGVASFRFFVGLSFAIGKEPWHEKQEKKINAKKSLLY